MMLKKNDILYSLSSLEIVELKITDIKDNKYTIEGFIEGPRIRNYTDRDIIHRRVDTKISRNGVKFYISRIVAHTEFKENISNKLLERPLILSRHQLEDILNYAEQEIQKCRDKFFNKDISDGTN